MLPLTLDQKRQQPLQSKRRWLNKPAAEADNKMHVEREF